ncbi:MAG: methyltransferase domain-containing protein [Clostridiales bacterium]|nr:methyltransferase domain-containing protein [Clostridiales bacterium]
MSVYGDFAALYDAFMADVPYKSWCGYLHSLIQTRKPGAKVLLDMACGTGSITRGMHKIGYRVSGSDLSDAMLRRATELSRSEGKSIPFYHMDLTDFTVINPVEVITVMCDGINYLNGEQLCEFASCAYDALTDGGLLLFDLRTAYQMHEVMGDNTFADENDDGAYILITHKEEDGTTMELTLFLKAEGESYRRSFESHRLYIHSAEDAADALYEAGFSEVEAYGFLTEQDMTGSDERIMMIARR